MKRFGFFLLAIVMVAGMASCGPGDFFFVPTVQNMADVYDLTKATVPQGGGRVTLVPPEISGTVKLSRTYTYDLDITIPGLHITRSGTYDVSDDPTETYSVILDGGEEILFILDDGLKLSYMAPYDGAFRTFEFTRS